MKSRAPIIVAIVLAIIAVLAINAYIRRIKAEYEQKMKGQKIVAASQDIPAGTELQMPMVEPKEVPPQFIPAQAVKGSDELAQVIGRKTRFRIKAGQPVLWSDFIESRAGGLASLVPATERAFTITVTRGVTGSLLQPNDHIDIIASFALPQPTEAANETTATWRQASDMVNVVLLQNVTVLAIGETVGPTTLEAASTGANSGGPITVSVTLPEAQLLMFASQHGELGVALRNEENIETDARETLPRVTFKALEDLIGDLDSMRKKRIIQIQKGRSTEAVAVGEE